jgi:hypothetical protein
MKLSSTLPMRPPLSHCTLMAVSETMVPMLMRWRRATAGFATLQMPASSGTMR